MTEIPKVIRGGKVAVIVSPPYGAGWSTWADNPERAAFAPKVVAWIEAGKPALERGQFKEYGCLLGLPDTELEWVDVGTRFHIDEYDGSEALVVHGPDFGYVA